MGLTLLLFGLAARKRKLVPTGVQNIAEAGIDFIRESVILQTIGPEGMGYLPFLTTMFFFVFFINIFEILPFIQFPGNARIAVPLFLALVVWFIFNIVGIAKQGFGSYMKSSLVPPGVPHTFANRGDAVVRMLNVHAPAGFDVRLEGG